MHACGHRCKHVSSHGCMCGGCSVPCTFFCDATSRDVPAECFDSGKCRSTPPLPSPRPGETWSLLTALKSSASKTLRRPTLPETQESGCPKPNDPDALNSQAKPSTSKAAPEFEDPSQDVKYVTPDSGIIPTVSSPRFFGARQSNAWGP